MLKEAILIYFEVLSRRLSRPVQNKKGYNLVTVSLFEFGNKSKQIKAVWIRKTN